MKQFKALLAAEIIKALDKDGLTVRAPHARTGLGDYLAFFDPHLRKKSSHGFRV